MTSLFQLVLAAAVMLLWLRARPVVEPERIRAKTASPRISDQEWIEHGRQVARRERGWRRQRRDWLRALAGHLKACEGRWWREGWRRTPTRVLAFHRTYAETYAETQR